MPDFDRVIEYLKLRPSREVVTAARFLERKGYVFAVDFGTQNAVQKAKTLRRRCKRKA